MENTGLLMYIGLLMCEEFVKVEFVLIEAMAGYNGHGLLDLIQNGEKGLLCEANPEVIVEKVVELLHNDNMHSRLSWNALACAREFLKAVEAHA